MFASNLSSIIGLLAFQKQAPVLIRKNAFLTFGDMMRGNNEIQSEMVKMSTKQQIVTNKSEFRVEMHFSVGKLARMFLEKEEMVLRLASLYTFECLLHENQKLQLILTSSLAKKNELSILFHYF